MKAKFGPRASVREMKTYEDLDWFISNHKWALIGKEQMGVYSKETYLTPSGNFVVFVLSDAGKIRNIFQDVVD